MDRKIKINHTRPILILALLFSCAHSPPQVENDDDLVSVDAALFQARSSYLLGCTEARVALKAKNAFEHCSYKAQKHLLELKSIMEQKLE